MESRNAHDAGAVRRSGAFSGRQMPLEMGTLRVGGSGRPVPAVFSAAAARRPVTSYLEPPAASATALSPRLTLEPHPRSPFRRREELSQTVVRSRDGSARSRFQVKKVTSAYALSARSPQIRSKGTKTKVNEAAARSHEMRASRSSIIDDLASGEDAYDERVEQNVWKTQPRGRRIQEEIHVEGERRPTSAGEASPPAADVVPTGETTTRFVEERAYPDAGKASKLRPKTLPLPVTSPGPGTFVSSMPSLTKLRSSFTARELALFTQRQEVTEADSHARYHVASHPNATSVAVSSAAFRTNQGRIQEKPNGHKRALSSHTSRRESEQVSVNEQRPVESSWTRVDTSIDHIYEDPVTDVVQLHLLHSHHASTGQKKRKMVERERTLTAASGLREHQIEMRRQQEQLQKRKLQVQKMSEAIRQQNQRAVQARVVRSGEISDRLRKSNQRAGSVPNFPERKPPVPRLSRNSSTVKQQKHKKNSKEHPQLPGVSTSILMGVPLGSSNEIGHQDLNINREGEGDKNDADVRDAVFKPLAKHQTGKRRPPATTPRASKREKRIISALPSENDAAIRAKEERRAIAREYMQLQKTSRRIWNAKAKEQYQREQEKRQHQLEILEATRLKKLRLSKKRADSRKNREHDDPVLPDDVAMETIAMSISPENGSILRGSVMHTLSQRETNAEATRSDGKIIFDEHHLDNENDRAIGNLNVSERSELVTKYDTLFISGAEERESLVVMREQNDGSQASERVRKLLELREKAAALSARLSGLRKQPDTIKVLVANEISQHESIDTTANGVTGSTSGVNDSQTPVDTPVVDAVDGFASQPGSDDAIQDDVEHSTHGDSDHGEEVDESNSDSSDDDEGLQDEIESRNRSSQDDEEKDDLDGSENGETLGSISASRQVVHQIQTLSSASETFEDDMEVDIRSIGVYNISTVWPSSIEATEGVSETNFLSESQRASSLSASSSSTSSSPRDAPRIVQQDVFAGQLNDNHDESQGDSAEDFEVKFYEQMKSRLQRSTIDSDEPTPNQSSRIKSEENARYRSDSDSDLECSPVQTLQRGLPPVTGINPVSVNQPSRPNAGLLKLIRETDDSLSVIDRAAKALYREQLERSEREKERELQVRIEAEKKKLIETDSALKAVMDSLTSKRASDDDDDSGVNNLEHGDDLQSEDGDTEIQIAQYKRLEEIMDEVEKERSQENKEKNDSPQPVLRFDDRDRNITRGQADDLSSNKNIQSRGRIPVSTSSSFWDLLVSGPAPHDIDVGCLNTSRPHVAVDDSELIAQREARLREDDENRTDYTDSPPRVHSPRTLSKRLMAAVDYQEAIFEAHMQLAMIEHAHELETVQAETVTLAQAFKEEMEHNATAHQLALDHATLEKKFDDDMQDVMQQLNTIRQTEEEERAAQESHIEQRLRQANLRECSVQTEILPRADAATSAVLYVDTSTSPIRVVSDAAVQHDTIEPTAEVSANANDEDELEYSRDGDANPYEETFEQESQLQMDVETYDKRDASKIRSNAELLSRSRSQSEDTEIHSVLSEADAVTDDNNVAKSGMTKPSVVQTEHDVVEDDVEDELALSENLAEHDNEGPASISYEEDFEASSSKTKSARADTVEDTVAESEIFEEGEAKIEEAADMRLTTAEEVVSEDTQNEPYSSQFEDTSHGNSRSTVQPMSGNGGISTDKEISENGATPSGINDNDDCNEEIDATSEEPHYSDASFASELEQNELSQSEHLRQSELVEDAVPTIAEEEEFCDEQQTSDIKDESDNYDVEYENDYENDSFDETRSATDVHSEDIPDPVKEYRGDDIIDGPTQNPVNVSADSVESEHYSSQFEDTSRGNLREAVQEVRSEIARDKEVNEIDEDGATRPGLFVEEYNKGTAVTNDENQYSENAFESGQMEQTSQHFLVQQSLSVHEEQSNSEDSSTTKLLIAEACILQKAVGELSAVRSQAEADKLAMKKSKAQELLQAKEQYIYQQKEAFRRDEEKRQVDMIAKLALKIDVESELQRAKTEINQQLASEFDDLQQAYPIIRSQADVTGEGRPIDPPHMAKKKSAPSPSERGKISVGHDTDRGSVDGDAYDVGYESDSFEEDKSDVLQVESKVKVGEQSFEDAGYETGEVGSRHMNTQSSTEGVEMEASNDQVASEVSSHPSEIGEDAAASVGEENTDLIIDELQMSEGKANAVSSEGEYENSYENESFDEDPSAATLPSEDVNDQVENRSVEHDTGGDGAHDNSDYEDEYAYSDEGFDSASESFNNEASPPSIGLNTDTIATGSASATEENLTQAVESVVKQIRDEEPTNKPSLLQPEDNASSRYAGDKNKALASSVSVSISHDDGEEEVLTKSIEERTTRLQELRQRILDRKQELLAVEKQMRVEKHKEQLAAEEKLLWGELESVEKLLRADEEALELCRQRNRLEVMNLQARQLTHASRKEQNLLYGYNYVEDIEPIDNDINPGDIEPADRVREDLLDGYNYVEDIDPIDDNTKHVVARDIEPAHRVLEDLLGGVEYIEPIDGTTNPVVSRDIGRVREDLLGGYNYVEAVEPINNGINPVVDRDIEPVDRVLKGSLDENVEEDEPIESDINRIVARDIEPADRVLADLLDGYNYVEDIEPIEDDTDPVLGRDIEPAEQELESALDGNVEESESIGNGTNSFVTRDIEPADRVFADLLDGYNYIETIESINDGTNHVVARDIEPADRVLDDSLDGNVEESDPIENYTNSVVSRNTKPADRELEDSLDRTVEDTEPVENSTNSLGARDIEPAARVLADSLGDYDYVEGIEPIDNDTNSIVVDTESEAASGAGNDLDKAAASERIADDIFLSVYDDIVNSELRIWSLCRFSASTESGPQRSVTSTNASTFTTSPQIGLPLESVNRMDAQSSRARDLNLTQQLVERLEIVHDELRLPVVQGAFENRETAASPTAHALYDTVEALANDYFNAIHRTSTGERPLDTPTTLEVIRRHVETEVNGLLAIREQSERELERQLQLLSDETGAEDGLNGDLLLSQNCIASNVSNIVSKVQSDLSRTTEELSNAVQPSRSGIFPRTPTSRARNTSILSSLQTQQDQELQQRLTAMILGDLLQDAGLP